MRGALHNLTHSHTLASKPGVGEFAVCAWRLLPGCRVAFRPDLGGAGWHPVPPGGAFPSMLAASSAHEAMAILRAVTSG
jgi:hypothetical protein